jgi:ribosomal protein S5
MVQVSMEKGTVPYNTETKYKSAKIMLHPASQ